MEFRVNETTVHSEVSGETVLLNLSTGVYFGLDEIGTRMWTLLVEHGSTDKVVSTVLNEYDAQEDRVKADLDALLAELKQNGLVELHD